MFTGIIEAIGTIKTVVKSGDFFTLTLESSLDLSEVSIGDSVAVNGACFSVVKKQGSGFTIDVSAESLQRTNLKGASQGNQVHLERALRLSDRLNGHLVLGHVDGVGTIDSLKYEGKTARMGIAVPAPLLPLIVEKGSIAIDGVSLTITQVEEHPGRFYVMLIPLTLEKTLWREKKVGDPVNIETDVIGKYIQRFFNAGRGDQGGRSPSSITEGFMEQYGYK